MLLPGRDVIFNPQVWRCDDLFLASNCLICILMFIFVSELHWLTLLGARQHANEPNPSLRQYGGENCNHGNSEACNVSCQDNVALTFETFWIPAVRKSHLFMDFKILLSESQQRGGLGNWVYSSSCCHLKETTSVDPSVQEVCVCHISSSHVAFPRCGSSCAH